MYILRYIQGEECSSFELVFESKHWIKTNFLLENMRATVLFLVSIWNEIFIQIKLPKLREFFNFFIQNVYTESFEIPWEATAVKQISVSP
jgi:hypothetical protein